MYIEYICRHRASARLARLIVSLITGLAVATGFAATPSPTLKAIKELSFEELLDLEVTSVSRHPEKLTETASAIQVLSGDDVRRSAANTLPGALALLPNVHVSQLLSHAHVVTTRGFSNIFPNKLLVLVDGRSVYTPLFAGVFWDVQNVLLEDLQRIEVVSGPGGSVWGANAVNGVINITTKSARDTQGAYVLAGGGSFMDRHAAVRYGGKIGPNLYYRAHAQEYRWDGLDAPAGAPNYDAWEITSGGGRLDWYPSGDDTLTLQGDLYDGTQFTMPGDTRMKGGNILGRWSRSLGQDSDLTVQAFYDRTWREAPPSVVTEELRTYDFEMHHRFPVGEKHTFLWGAGYRNMESSVVYHTPLAGFVPPEREMELYSLTMQDEIVLVPEKGRLTLGTKLEHHEFSAWEVQPNVRTAWNVGTAKTVWAAISRAIRAPSRIDVDYHIPGRDIEPGEIGVDGGPDFDSEKLVAYEAGFRWQAFDSATLSLSGFYNRYDDIYSVEAIPGTPTYRIQNGTEGQSWGAEIAFSWQATRWWRLRGGYTYFEKQLWNKPGHSFDTVTLGNDPRHQGVIHSMMNLPGSIEADIVVKYVSSLPNPAIPDRLGVDARLAWRRNYWEIAVSGRNLADPRHPEFATLGEVPRQYWAEVVFRW